MQTWLIIFIVAWISPASLTNGQIRAKKMYDHPLTFLNPRWPLKLKPDWFSPRACFINFSFAILYCIPANKFNNFGLKVIILRHRGSRQKTSGWWFYIIAHIWFLQRQCIITKCVFIVLKREQRQKKIWMRFYCTKWVVGPYSAVFHRYP